MKVLFVLAPEGYKDEEFEIPNKIIKAAGIETVLTNSTGNPSKSVAGKITEVNIKLEDVNNNDYDAVIFVGGPGADVYFNDSNALKIVRDFYNKNKIIAAICIAPMILANAGILNKKTVTCYPSEKENISKIAKYSGNDVEIDDNIITGRDPSAAEKFGQAILNALKNL